MVLSQNVSIQWLGNVFLRTWSNCQQLVFSAPFGRSLIALWRFHDIQRTLTQTTIESLLDGLMAMAALVMMFITLPR